jgi:hypothetical protein
MIKQLFLFISIAFGIMFFGNIAHSEDTHPIISIEQKIIDFGTVIQGENLTKQIKVINSGSRPLKISNVRGSCGLMVTAFPRQDIAPGESGIISFKYDTSRLGEFERNITIHSNSEENSVKIIVKGIIKKK